MRIARSLRKHGEHVWFSRSSVLTSMVVQLLVWKVICYWRIWLVVLQR